jgi:hypothetical protein
MDAIGFLAPDLIIHSEDQGFSKKRTRADGGSTRYIHWEGRPSFTAKNRYGLPTKMMIPQDFNFEKTLAPYFPTALGWQLANQGTCQMNDVNNPRAVPGVRAFTYEDGDHYYLTIELHREFGITATLCKQTGKVDEWCEVAAGRRPREHFGAHYRETHQDDPPAPMPSPPTAF